MSFSVTVEVFILLAFFGTAPFYSRYTLILDLVIAITTTPEIYSHYPPYLIELYVYTVYVSRFSYSTYSFILTPLDRTKYYLFLAKDNDLIYIREDEKYKLNRKSLAITDYI